MPGQSIRSKAKPRSEIELRNFANLLWLDKFSRLTSILPQRDVLPDFGCAGDRCYHSYLLAPQHVDNATLAHTCTRQLALAGNGRDVSGVLKSLTLDSQ